MSHAAADLQADVFEWNSITAWGNPPTVPITHVLAKNDACERKIKEGQGVPTTPGTAPARPVLGRWRSFNGLLFASQRGTRCCENLRDISGWTFPANSSEGQIVFLPRLSEKRSTGKKGLVGCELGGWLVFRDHDCTFIRGSLWVIQEEINAKCLA